MLQLPTNMLASCSRASARGGLGDKSRVRHGTGAGDRLLHFAAHRGRQTPHGEPTTRRRVHLKDSCHGSVHPSIGAGGALAREARANSSTLLRWAAFT